MLALTFEGALFRRAFQRSMPPHLDMPYFGEEETITNDLNSVTPLGEHKGVEAACRLEARVALLFCMFLAAAEEVLKGSLQTFEGLLQHLGMDIADRFGKRF